MSRLNLLVIRSNDIDAAAKLYSCLGLRFVKHAHGSGPAHYASESCGSVFEIYPLSDAQSPTSSTRIGFEVESVSKTVESLLSLGARMVSPPRVSNGCERAVIADLDGHKVELSTASTTAV